MIRALTLLLALAYPLLAHAAAWTQRPGLVLAAAAVLLLAVLAAPLSRGRPWAMVALVLGAAGLWGLHATGQAMLPLYLPPVLLNLFMAWVFGASLTGGGEALLTRVARVMHGEGPLPEGVAGYTRRLTLAWTLLFLALAVLSLVLALLATPDGLLLAAGVVPPVTVAQATWSLFANILNYVLVAALLVGEFLWRRHRFPDTDHGGLAGFLRRMAALGPAFWRRGGG